MDWNLILGFVFGGTSLGGIITSIIFFKANKKLKESEVKQSEADVEEKQISNDKAQIDLGTTFLKETMEMTAKVKEMMLASDKERDTYWRNQEKMLDKLTKSVSSAVTKITKVEKDVAAIKEEQRIEIAYLNGDYKKFKEQMRQRLEDENKLPPMEEKKKTGRPSRYVPVPMKKTRKTAKAE